MKLSRFAVTLFAAVCMVVSAFAQANPATAGPGSYGSRYGLTAWAINNQRVASQYNYFIDSTTGGNAVNAGAYTFPINTCTQALSFGGGRNLNPFNANASIKINDITSANSETVTPAATPVTYSGSLCTLNITPTNTHTSFQLRSGTCGLREALNDLGTNGGEVIVDQAFYDAGCTQSTITGLALSGGLQANQYIHDVSNGQDTWYALKPTTTSLIAAGAAPTNTTGTGGLSSGAYITSYEYVDPVGGLSLPATDSAQTATTTQVTIASPAATTGAVGWIPMITAAGGSNGTEIEVPVTSAVCTLSTESVKPACAIGASALVNANPSSTAKEVVESTAHTTFAYQPIAGVPTFANAGLGSPQTAFLPFAAVATVSSGSNSDVAQWYIPAGALNFLGKTIDVCFKAASTNAATAVPTWKLNASNQYAQSPVTLATVVLPTQTGAVTTDGCFQLRTGATGSSGTLWASTPGGVSEAINSTGVTVSGMEVTTAASSALDLTKGIYMSLNLGAGTANITSVTVNNVDIRQVGGN